MKQPKFNFGQKVCLNKNKNVSFVVGRIRWACGRDFFYSGENSIGEFYEDNLTEVKEPLKAEFECQWQDQESIHPIGCSMRTILTPFVGKRTRVTIEEIVE